MKRMLQSITIFLLLILCSSNVTAQQATKTEAEKQKETEQQLKQKQAEDQEKKMEEVQKKIQAAAEEERVRADRKAIEFERQARDLEEIRKRAEEMSKKAVVVVPDNEIWSIRTPGYENYYVYGNWTSKSKAGSSWNYSRQVMESTFDNEFTMSAGGESNVNLTVAGDCAEGNISVQIIMPDGKQLSEVVIDSNGSLNWRKSFESSEDNKWKNGKWVFRIKAKDATGNVRISMTAD